MRCGQIGSEATCRDTLGSDSEAAVSNQLEVLKVPHHGAQSSTSSVFLRSASPWLSVISVGPAGGHPSEAALTRLARYSQVVSGLTGQVYSD